MGRAGIFGSARVAAGGGGGITATFQASATSGTDGSSFSFASQPIGTAGASRRVVVAFGWAAASSLIVSSVTIGGVSATIDVDSGGTTGNRRVVIASAVVPTGTTATVAVTLSGSAVRMGIGVWTLTGGSATGQTATVINSTSGTLTVTTSTNDVVICAGYYSGASGSAVTAWTGATERFDDQVENTFNSTTGADVVASGASTAVDFASSGAASANQVGFVAAAYA